jgi:hypothetical protein
MPYRAAAEVVLDRWGEVERDLKTVMPGSPEGDALIEEWARLRIEYQRLFDQAREHRQPVPAAWPEPEPEAG